VADFVGTSGWQYRDWRGSFYPDGVPMRRWLEHYAEQFPTVEVNSTFYRLPDRSVFERWRAATPESFVFAPKMSRFLTHVKRLKEPAEPVARYLERAEALGPKLGPTLVQLPPNLAVDVAVLDQLLDCWPDRRRLAIEFRHESWFTEEVSRRLADHDVALCLSDRDEEMLTPMTRTASWTYVRFHAGRGDPLPCYRESTLRRWCTALARSFDQSDDLYAYFNNDPRGCAPRDAATFAALRRGLSGGGAG
jgi:uncharacterized protein YecE (DUF72 family)